MKEAKITEIVNEHRSWTSAQGNEMHEYCVTVQESDGTTVSGIASSTNPENPPYAVGDNIFYESNTNAYGTKLKIKKELQQNGAARGGGDRQREISIQWALGRATEVLPYEEGNGYYQAVKSFAVAMLDLKDEILTK